MEDLTPKLSHNRNNAPLYCIFSPLLTEEWKGGNCKRTGSKPNYNLTYFRIECSHCTSTSEDNQLLYILRLHEGLSLPSHFTASAKQLCPPQQRSCETSPAKRSTRKLSPYPGWGKLMISSRYDDDIPYQVGIQDVPRLHPNLLTWFLPCHAFTSLSASVIVGGYP